MGLDNGFILKSRKNPEMAIEMAYFRKYYELNHLALWAGNQIEGDEYNVEFNEEMLMTFLNAEVKPVYEVINKLPGRIEYYDENGYGKDVSCSCYGYALNPATSQSYAAGYKLIKLYHNLVTMIETLQNNNLQKDDLYFIFYSSF